MWVFTLRGFMSVVEDRKDESKVWVRFRREEEANDMAEEYFVGAPVIQLKRECDYPYRVHVEKRLLWVAMNKIQEEIEYDNFKDAVEDHDRERAERYCEVWSLLKEHEHVG